ncbi:MAG: hypothetical protein M3Z05_18840 [Gemmatimonadota bacterium]|nr:hypothetical protein [Gemmatimonadota bacterium]
MAAWLSSLACIQLLAFAACRAEVPATPSAKAGPATTAVAPALSDQPSDRRTAGQPGCRFERPEVWAAGTVSWIGNCRSGFANDSGVIVMVVKGAEPERFYGRVQDGHLRVGVLQSPNGFMAGTWVNGALAAALADDVAQRNALIAAFRVAANAATSASNSLAKKGDATASRYYAKQAKLLHEQID